MKPFTRTQALAIKDYALNRRSGSNYRITDDWALEICGPMPNSIETGWWFAGYVDELLKQFEMEERP